MKKILFIACLSLLYNSAAWAQNHSINIETQPIGYILNAIPGTNFYQASIEIPLGPVWALAVSGKGISFDTSKWKDQQNGASADSETLPKDWENLKAVAQSFDLVSRWYTNTMSDSWYCGLGGTYAQGNVQANYGDEKIESSITSAQGKMEGGYRWIWSAGFLLRLGVDLSKGFKSNVKTQSTLAESQRKDDVTNPVDNKKIAFGANLGLGWAF